MRFFEVEPHVFLAEDVPTAGVLVLQLGKTGTSFSRFGASTILDGWSSTALGLRALRTNVVLTLRPLAWIVCVAVSASAAFRKGNGCIKATSLDVDGLSDPSSSSIFEYIPFWIALVYCSVCGRF